MSKFEKLKLREQAAKINYADAVFKLARTYFDGKNKERDFCILILFLNCGLRLSELVGINLTDIKGDTLRVLGKGNKERFVYFGSACRKAIDAYLPERNKKFLSDNRALFGSRDNNRISVTAVHRLIKKYLLK